MFGEDFGIDPSQLLENLPDFAGGGGLDFSGADPSNFLNLGDASQFGGEALDFSGGDPSTFASAADPNSAFGATIQSLRAPGGDLMTANPGAPTAPNGITTFASQLLGKGGGLGTVSQLLGLGAGGLGIANALGAANRAATQQRVQQQGQQVALSAAQPAIDYGKTQLAATTAGQLPAPMEAYLADLSQRLKADVRARLSHLGISDSTMLEDKLREVDTKIATVRAQLLQSQGAGGVQALNVGAGLGLNAGQQGAQSEALIANLLASVNQQLGLQAARG